MGRGTRQSFRGTLQQGCVMSPFGCCLDGYTPAQGFGNVGCTGGSLKVTTNDGFVSHTVECEKVVSCQGCVTRGCQWSLSQQSCYETWSVDDDRAFDIYTCPASERELPFVSLSALPAEREAASAAATGEGLRKCLVSVCESHQDVCDAFSTCTAKNEEERASQGETPVWKKMQDLENCMPGLCALTEFAGADCPLISQCQAIESNKCDKCAREKCASSKLGICLTSCYSSTDCGGCVEKECKKEENKGLCEENDLKSCIIKI